MLSKRPALVIEAPLEGGKATVSSAANMSSVIAVTLSTWQKKIEIIFRDAMQSLQLTISGLHPCSTTKALEV